jgi:hypothetical protein
MSHYSLEQNQSFNPNKELLNTYSSELDFVFVSLVTKLKQESNIDIALELEKYNRIKKKFHSLIGERLPQEITNKLASYLKLISEVDLTNSLKNQLESLKQNSDKYEKFLSEYQIMNSNQKVAFVKNLNKIVYDYKNISESIKKMNLDSQKQLEKKLQQLKPKIDKFSNFLSSL